MLVVWGTGAASWKKKNLYTECRGWRREQSKLRGVLQRRPGRRWLGSLLASERAVGPELKFLEGTGVGSREGARERELEWQRRNDQERENQLAD